MPPPQISSPPRRRPESLEERRLGRLRLTVFLAGWWLLAQGAVYLVLGDWLSIHFQLRFDAMLVPYLRLLALTLLCLGLFLLKALRDPRRQYLAIDVLILYLLGHVYFLLNFRLSGYALMPFEWASGAADLALGASLVMNRTRSTQMLGAGSLLSGRAVDLFDQTKSWLQKKGPAPKPTLGDLEAPAPEAEAKASEAIPHMD